MRGYGKMSGRVAGLTYYTFPLVVSIVLSVVVLYVEILEAESVEGKSNENLSKDGHTLTPSS